MTANRRRVLAEYQRAALVGERVNYAEMARRCGLFSYREARRTIRDLRKAGYIAG